MADTYNIDTYMIQAAKGKVSSVDKWLLSFFISLTWLHRAEPKNGSAATCVLILLTPFFPWKNFTSECIKLHPMQPQLGYYTQRVGHDAGIKYKCALLALMDIFNYVSHC